MNTSISTTIIVISSNIVVILLVTFLFLSSSCYYDGHSYHHHHYYDGLVGLTTSLWGNEVSAYVVLALQSYRDYVFTGASCGERSCQLSFQADRVLSASSGNRGEAAASWVLKGAGLLAVQHDFLFSCLDHLIVFNPYQSPHVNVTAKTGRMYLRIPPC